MNKPRCLYAALVLLASLAAGESWSAPPPPTFIWVPGTSARGNGIAAASALLSTTAAALQPLSSYGITDSEAWGRFGVTTPLASGWTSHDSITLDTQAMVTHLFAAPFSEADDAVLMATASYAMASGANFIKFDASVNAPHGQVSWGAGTNLIDHNTKHAVPDLTVDVPFRMAMPATLQVTTTLSECATVDNIGGTTPLPAISGQTSGTWSLWLDADGDGVIDPARDAVVASGTYHTAICDPVGPSSRTVPIDPKYYVLRFHYTAYSAMSFHPPVVNVFDTVTTVTGRVSMIATVR